MQLSDHEKTILQKLAGGVWQSQRQLKTSRQTLNKLIKNKLIVRRMADKKQLCAPGAGQVYRRADLP
jgi:DNA-binding CsgD family transcriptional regulator